MKKANTILVTVGLLIGAAVFWWTQPRQSESNKVLSNGISLTNQWLTVTPASDFKTVGPWSELFIVLPGKSSFEGNPPRLFLENVGEVEIEGYLVADDGSKVGLTQSEVMLNEQGLVSLSSPALQWKDRDYLFRNVALRSNFPIRTGKLIWVSDDPREHKDGTLHPKLD